MTDYIVNIDASNAAALLIDESHKRPVVTDFWSERSAPSKTLTPLLEKIATEYQGAFLLARVNADKQPGIAQQLGVRSLPTVMVIQGGQPVDGFAGAQSETFVRKLLEKYLQRVPTRHPLRRWKRRFAREVTPLLAGGPTHYQHWAEAGPHQMGAAFELAACYLVWIAGGGSGSAHLVQAADAFRQLSVLARSLLLKGARAVESGQPFQEYDLVDRMVRHWSRGMALLGAGEIELDAPTRVLRPGYTPDGHPPPAG